MFTGQEGALQHSPCGAPIKNMNNFSIKDDFINVPFKSVQGAQMVPERSPNLTCHCGKLAHRRVQRTGYCLDHLDEAWAHAKREFNHV